MPLAALAEQAPHLVGNAMAVLALVRAVAPGATAAAVAAVADFRGMPHQHQVVGERDGITFVDDSKATNPTAAAAALHRHRRVVLIAGGRNKGLSFAPLLEAGKGGRVQAVVGLGESGSEIVRLFSESGIPGVLAASMDEAVAAASDRAVPGDVVLLAPACASHDMYRDQAARGDAFIAAVQGAGWGCGLGAGKGGGMP